MMNSETVGIEDGPLSGVRVLDAGTILAAPMVGALLGDFGAEVIKVEEPNDGDPIRQYPPQHCEQAVGSKVTNRNKKNIGIDLRTDRGREVFKDLVRQSDVVIMNYRPETLAGWGLDYEDLVSVKPDVVMLHLTGFGRTGPYKERPGFARVAEAYAGLTYITGFPDGPPVFAGYPVADGLGGVYGAFSVMLALYHRQATGRGQLVDLALYEPILRMIEDMVVSYDLTGRVRERHGNINPHVAPNDIYQTQDGKWLALPSSTPNMYLRLCEALGMPLLSTDPRFKTNALRVENRKALDDELRPVIEGYQSEHLLNTLHGRGVAACVVNDARDIYNDPHLWERESLIKVWDENLSREVAMPGVFPRLSDSPGRVRQPGRERGQDTQTILKEFLGCDDSEIRALSEAGVVTKPESDL